MVSAMWLVIVTILICDVILLLGMLGSVGSGLRFLLGDVMCGGNGRLVFRPDALV
jgi:hypothetical protein